MRYLVLAFLLAGCSSTAIVRTTGALGCAPNPLTDYQIRLIRQWQQRFPKGDFPAEKGMSGEDYNQVVYYITRCGQMDPVTGEFVP